MSTFGLLTYLLQVCLSMFISDALIISVSVCFVHFLCLEPRETDKMS